MPTKSNGLWYYNSAASVSDCRGISSIGTICPNTTFETPGEDPWGYTLIGRGERRCDLVYPKKIGKLNSEFNYEVMRETAYTQCDYMGDIMAHNIANDVVEWHFQFFKKEAGFCG